MRKAKRIRVIDRTTGDEVYRYSIYPDGRYSYSMSIKDCASSRYLPEGKELVISINEGYATVIGPLNIKDLKALRKLIRKAIRNYESNEPVQI